MNKDKINFRVTEDMDRRLRVVAAKERKTRTAVVVEVLEKYLGGLDDLSPLNVLKRGYSITRLLPSYRIVRESGMLSQGDEVNVVLGKGELFCKVEKINE